MFNAALLINKDLKININQVEKAIELIDEGATVPFIARYRKEATGGMDDTQLRFLSERLHYLRELNERREVILKSIEEQGKLTETLKNQILESDNKTRLEDLYLPYKPKRQSKALSAINAGLLPLAEQLLRDNHVNPDELASGFINQEHGVDDTKAALDGARHILMEQFSEHADLLSELRQDVWAQANIVSKVVENAKKKDIAKFSDYFDYAEAIKKIPSHRILALLRGRREGILSLALELPEAMAQQAEQAIMRHFNLKDVSTFIADTIRMTWKIKILTKIELELMARLREQADEEAIAVFGRNLKDLLLAAPAGNKRTMGLDPGIRTGVKVAVIDETGKLLDYTTVFPLPPQNDWHPSIAELAKLAMKHNVSLISIGNGTGSRETDRLVGELIKTYPDLHLTKIMVNEAGASVYSASELAANEFPDLDVSYRGAVSIARRLQDPLAELVKIEPKSIGVGQYQHDVNQSKLARCLIGVVEDCVNAVGVDINTASVPLLTRVAGLNERLAKNIVEYRDEHGAFSNRDIVKLIPRMGEKTYQQAAGFLRIRDGDNPLDASAVHPESYGIVQRILADLEMDIKELMGNTDVLKGINLKNYTDEIHGLPTIADIVSELEKPGRDPRPEFKTAQFKDGIEDIKDLEEGMILEGVISNVTNFGAFVDIGVHQDGLVHISEMTHAFIQDPQKVVKAGDIVQVKVIGVDKERRRISLSMKLQQAKNQPRPPAKPRPQVEPKKATTEKRPNKPPVKKEQPPKNNKVFNTAMADALAKLKTRSVE